MTERIPLFTQEQLWTMFGVIVAVHAALFSLVTVVKWRKAVRRRKERLRRRRYAAHLREVW